MKIHDWLVSEWKQVLKFASTWAVLGSAGLQAAVQYWPEFPDDLKQYIPHIIVRALAWSSFPAIVIARMIRQNSLRPDKPRSEP
jgi:hypothetical protein